ncbi:MAG: MliC family protein [Rhodospirillales bacterium]|nr:MliC family protein [Rhodospirillales bacterium]
MQSVLIVAVLLAGGGPATDTIYSCTDMADPLMVRFQDASVQLRGDRQWMTLPQARSGSGARFTDGTVLFWIKGSNARYETGDGVIRKCHVTGRG